MQTQKDFVREQIIRASKQEFMQEGFQKASLRKISRQINASTGIIYSYFKNKDDLFSAVVFPAREYVINQRLVRLNDLNTFLQAFSPRNEQLYDPRKDALFANYVKYYQEELYILLYCSDGSSLEHFIDDFVEKKVVQYRDNLEEYAKKGGEIKLAVDDYFLRLPILTALAIVKEMVAKQMSDEELYEYERQVVPVLINAWRAIF